MSRHRPHLLLMEWKSFRWTENHLYGRLAYRRSIGRKGDSLDRRPAKQTRTAVMLCSCSLPRANEPSIATRQIHQTSGLDHIENFCFPTSWLAEANPRLPDEKWLKFQAWVWSSPAGGTLPRFGKVRLDCIVFLFRKLKGIGES